MTSTTSWQNGSYGHNSSRSSISAVRRRPVNWSSWKYLDVDDVRILYRSSAGTGPGLWPPTTPTTVPTGASSSTLNISGPEADVVDSVEMRMRQRRSDGTLLIVSRDSRMELHSEQQRSVIFINENYNSRAIAGRTARCRCTFRYISNFTTASCSFSATARISCWSLSADCSELSVKKWQVLERTSQIA